MMFSAFKKVGKKGRKEEYEVFSPFPRTFSKDLFFGFGKSVKFVVCIRIVS